MRLIDPSETVAVSLDGDTLFVKARMSWYDENEIIKKHRLGDESNSQHNYNTLLLQQNVTGWEGEGFGGVAFTKENLLRMPANDPLMVAAFEKIKELNATPYTPEKKETI